MSQPSGSKPSLYFVVAKGRTDVIKHANATRAEVKGSVDDGLLQVEVRDDGIGACRSLGSLHGWDGGQGERPRGLIGTLLQLTIV